VISVLLTFISHTQSSQSGPIFSLDIRLCTVILQNFTLSWSGLAHESEMPDHASPTHVDFEIVFNRFLKSNIDTAYLHSSFNVYKVLASKSHENAPEKTDFLKREHLKLTLDRPYL
jgi:hypothetical protein